MYAGISRAFPHEFSWAPPQAGRSGAAPFRQTRRLGAPLSLGGCRAGVGDSALSDSVTPVCLLTPPCLWRVSHSGRKGKLSRSCAWGVSGGAQAGRAERELAGAQLSVSPLPCCQGCEARRKVLESPAGEEQGPTGDGCRRWPRPPASLSLPFHDCPADICLSVSLDPAVSAGEHVAQGPGLSPSAWGGAIGRLPDGSASPSASQFSGVREQPLCDGVHSPWGRPKRAATA